MEITNSPVSEQQRTLPLGSNHIPLVSSKAGLLDFLIKSKVIAVDFSPLFFLRGKKRLNSNGRKKRQFFTQSEFF